MSTPKENAESICSVYDKREREEFVEAMAIQHRTHQQGFTTLCLAWLTHLSALEKGKGEYDQRNEASVQVARGRSWPPFPTPSTACRGSEKWRKSTAPENGVVDFR